MSSASSSRLFGIHSRSAEERVDRLVAGGQRHQVDAVHDRVAGDGGVVEPERVAVPVEERLQLRVGDDLTPLALVVLLPPLVLGLLRPG
jgi:hypothetical protein